MTIAGGEMATGPLEPAVRSRLPLFALLTRLREYVGKIPALTLAEVVYTSEGTPVFVDIKNFPWAIDYRPLFEPGRHTIYGGDRRGMPYQGAFSLDRLADIGPGSELHLDGRPLLSHFVTYALERGIASIRS